MTRKARRALFYFLLLAFLIIGTLVTFYSIGWRIDFDDFTLKQTGGIFIKSNPREIDIELDGKKIEQRKWLLVSGTLIKNLLPEEKYNVKLSKEGYRSWNNEIPVLAKTVSEINNVILLPENLTFETVASSTKDFWAEQDKIVTLGKKINYEGNTFLGSEFVGFLNGEEKAITYDAKQKAYMLNDLKKKTASNLSLTFSGLRKKDTTIKDRSAIQEIAAEGNEEAFIFTKEAVYAMNAAKAEISLVDSNFWRVAERAEGDFLLLYNGNKIALLNLSSKEKIFQKNLEEKIKEAKINEIRNTAILTENGNLLYIKGEEVKKIAEGVSSFTLSQKEKIAFIDRSGKIKVYNSEKDKTVEAEIFNPEKITKLEFLEESHILAIYPEAVYLMELAGENMELKNYSFYFERIANSSSGIKKFYFNKTNKEIYILDREGNLNRLDYFKNSL